MEIEAVSQALLWLRQTMPTVKHVVVVTDSQNLLKRVDGGLLRSEWIQSMEGCGIRKVTWIYAPSHTGVIGNEQADTLASGAPINSTIRMGKRELMSALTTALMEEEWSVCQNELRRLEERGVMKGGGRQSVLSGSARNIFNQINTGTISRNTLRWILEQGTEHLWSCPACNEVAPADNK